MKQKQVWLGRSPMGQLGHHRDSGSVNWKMVEMSEEVPSENGSRRDLTGCW